MFRGFITAVLFGVTVTVAVPAFGQGQPQRQNDTEPSRRLQVTIMENVLMQAVKSGANDLWNDLTAKFREVAVSAEAMLVGTPEAQGVRAPSGIVFFVRVPQMNGSFIWAVPRAAEFLRSQAQGQGQSQAQAQVIASRNASSPPPVAPVDADVVSLGDFGGAYRRFVTTALIDAMLKNSGALEIAPDEFLTVAARRNTPPDPLDLTDDVRTTTFTVQGRDLDAFHQKLITLEETRKRVVIRED